MSVIVSLNDSFTLKQDMCLNCGSFGKLGGGDNNNDAQLLSCIVSVVNVIIHIVLVLVKYVM